MKSVFNFLLLFVVSLNHTYSQKGSDTLRLFYKINESVSKKNNTILDSAIKKFGNTYCDVIIHGYADFLSGNAYNNTLSELRAQNVKKHILNYGVKNNLNIRLCRGHGEKYSESNGSNNGEPYSRRVDIIFQTKQTSELSTISIDSMAGKNEITRLKVGETLVLEGLFFYPGQHYLLEKSVATLQNLLQTLKDFPNLKIQIRGHVCCISGDSDGMDMETNEYNLSENRAKAINDYLVSKGINENRLSYIGLGHKEPLYPNELSMEEQQANRRVEIRIISR
ncbi:MAG: OmpA family protein [Bacteroidota bacterium]